MKAQYDTEEIKITPRFKAALIELMKAKCEMMAINEPDNPYCWTWRICELGDPAKSCGLQFEFGGDENKLKGARFRVIPANNPCETPSEARLSRNDGSTSEF